MSKFSRLKKGDKVKVCWVGSIGSTKGKGLATIGKVKEINNKEIVVEMVVDSYRLFPFNTEGRSTGVHDYWLELM